MDIYREYGMRTEKQEKKQNYIDFPVFIENFEWFLRIVFATEMPSADVVNWAMWTRFKIK